MDGQLQLTLNCETEQQTTNQPEHIDHGGLIVEPDGHICLNEPAKYSGKTWCCIKKPKFTLMRRLAIRSKLYAPSFAELELMYAEAVSSGMRCPICGIQMKFANDGNGRSNLISLDHCGGDSVRLICVGCNVKDSRSHISAEEIAYNNKHGLKYCTKCKTTKPVDEFYYDRVKQTYRTPCKICWCISTTRAKKSSRSKATAAAYYRMKRLDAAWLEARRTYARERYRANKDEINAKRRRIKNNGKAKD